jgi:hypothetical protein
MQTCLQSAAGNADIIVIHEPWIGTNEEEKAVYTISQRTFDSLLSHTEQCPRTITFYSKTNQHLQISLQPNICNDEETQVRKISTPTIDTTYLFNIFNETPRYKRKLPYTVERKLQHTNLPERTILAGDFNAHQRSVSVTTTVKEKTTPNCSPRPLLIGQNPSFSASPTLSKRKKSVTPPLQCLAMAIRGRSRLPSTQGSLLFMGVVLVPPLPLRKPLAHLSDHEAIPPPRF